MTLASSAGLGSAPAAESSVGRASRVGAWLTATPAGLLLLGGIGLALAGAATHATERSWQFLALAGALFPAMLFVSVVDLRTRRIPNYITVPGLVGALAVAALAGTGALASAALGAAAALLLTGIAFVAGRGSFGMGDVKLSGMVGAILGIEAIALFLVLGSFLGTLGATVALARGASRNSTIAFGPYLAAAAIILCCVVGPVAVR